MADQEMLEDLRLGNGFGIRGRELDFTKVWQNTAMGARLYSRFALSENGIVLETLSQVSQRAALTAIVMFDLDT